MPIDRPDIGETKGFEKHTRREEGLEAPFAAHGVFGKLVSDAGHGAQEGEHILAGLPHPAAGERPAQEAGQRAHVGRDGNLVVVEHHNEAAAHVPGEVQPLKGFAAGEGAVADDGDHVMVKAGEITCQRHAKCGGNGRRGMPDAKMVIGAFRPAGKPGDAAPLPQGREGVATAGKQFVGIGLMPHVPDELVTLKIETGKQGQRQIRHPQRRGKMASGVRHHVHNAAAHLSGQLHKLGVGKGRKPRG